MKQKKIMNAIDAFFIIAFAARLIPNISHWVAGEMTSYMDSVFLCIFVICWNACALIERNK